jgi:hypothetical protein
VLPTLKELQMATLNFLQFVYTLYCSRKCTSDCAEWRSVWNNRKIRDLSDFERGQTVGARSTGTLFTKIAQYYVYREQQFLRLCRHTRITGRRHQRRGTVSENQHWQKEFVVHWEGLFRKKNHRTTAAQVNCTSMEYLSWRPFPQKLSDVTWASQIKHLR